MPALGVCAWIAAVHPPGDPPAVLPEEPVPHQRRTIRHAARYVRGMSSTRSDTRIDVARARALTPGCAHVLHFNNAGAALMPQPVLDATVGQLQREATMGGYEAAASMAAATEAVYDSVARLIHAHRDEIALFEGSSQAWHKAFHAVPLAKGDRVLTASTEYSTNWLSLLRVRERTGCTIEVVPDRPSGEVDVDALAAMLDERVKLVMITHVATSNGMVNPVEEVGRAVRGSGALYLVDACQSVGQLPIDVARIGCDLLAAAGRKYLRGPRGTGFLFVRKDRLAQLEPSVIDIHAAQWTGRDTYAWRPDARRFETLEHSVATRLGLGAAVDHALGWGLEAIAERIAGLSAGLRERLEAIGGVRVHDRGRQRSGIVTFTVAGRSADELMADLRRHGINTTVSRIEAARLDMEPRGLERMVRASVHYYNTEEEVERFAEAIAARA